uniref:Uncharacterized protein n=1 Tax=Cucumis sativus TaxID=3659 RepID=A0A0A0LV61_CUCSA
MKNYCFPTLSQGLLFVWPDENGWERADATTPPRNKEERSVEPDDFDKPEFSSVTIQRDLFYGYDTLMENGQRERTFSTKLEICTSGLEHFHRLQGGRTKQNLYLSRWILMVPGDFLEQIRVTQGLVPSLFLLVTISTSKDFTLFLLYSHLNNA